MRSRSQARPPAPTTSNCRRSQRRRSIRSRIIRAVTAHTVNPAKANARPGSTAAGSPAANRPGASQARTWARMNAVSIPMATTTGTRGAERLLSASASRRYNPIAYSSSRSASGQVRYSGWANAVWGPNGSSHSTTGPAISTSSASIANKAHATVTRRYPGRRPG